MAGLGGKVALVSGFFWSQSLLCQAQEFCRDLNYFCKEGHCCGRGKCCTYYYEIWWFWSIWIVVAMVLLWCYFHRRIREASQRIRDIHSRQLELTPIVSNNANAVQEQARSSDQNYSALFGSSDPVQTKLPSYNEIGELPKEPPPYTHIVFANLPNTSLVGHTLVPSPVDEVAQNLTDYISEDAEGHVSESNSESDCRQLPKDESSDVHSGLPEYSEHDAECDAPLLPEADDAGSTRGSPPPPYKSTENLPYC